MASPAAWLPLGAAGHAAAWLNVPGEPADALLAALFSVESGSAVARSELGSDVARHSWDALVESLRAALHLGAPIDLRAAAEAEFKPWSGALLLQVRIAATPVQLLLNGACVASLVTPRPPSVAPGSARVPLTPVASAIAHRTLRVKVELTSFKLDLGTLQELRPGDVVPLPHGLDTPLLVSTQNFPLCTGFLGRYAGHKAIELARHHRLAAGSPTEIHAEDATP